MSVGAVARPLEGAARPGHFDGVATVVAILFDLVGAEHAYFGQKDAQQVWSSARWRATWPSRPRSIACPTVREPDGLALSSRNVHLSPERASGGAGPPPGAHGGPRGAGRPASDRPRRSARGCARSSPREPLAEPEYVSVADGTTLAELDRVDGPALLSLAVRFGTTRLIDNEPLGARSRRLMPGMAAGGRILLAYLVYFAAIGAAYPYLPVFYRDIGLGLEQIGLLTALQAAVQLLLGAGLGRSGRPLPAAPA